MIKRELNMETIERLFRSDRVSDSIVALNACAGRNDISSEWIEKGLNDYNRDVRKAAINACAGRNDIPLEWLENRLHDYEGDVRAAAVNTLVGRGDVTLEQMGRMLNDDYWDVRLAATKACACRDDIPLEWIKNALGDEDEEIREAAIHYFKAWNLPIPSIRTFEPPAVVYKKCFNNVIVCAEIPADAQVRGAEGYKCRADKAKIIDIIGDVYGERVGVSTYDCSTLYFVGDEIEIEDFDCGDEECSTGFHFFCTREEAENYFFPTSRFLFVQQKKWKSEKYNQEEEKK